MFELFFTLLSFFVVFLFFFISLFYFYFLGGLVNIIQGPFGVDFIGLIKGPTQFQIRKKLSQEPVATAIPSSVTPRQLTRLS